MGVTPPSPREPLSCSRAHLQRVPGAPPEQGCSSPLFTDTFLSRCPSSPTPFGKRSTQKVNFRGRWVLPPRGTWSPHGFLATSPRAAAWYPVTTRIYCHQPRSPHGFIAPSPRAATWYPVTARMYHHQSQSPHRFIATSPGAAAWYPVTTRIYRHQPQSCRVVPGHCMDLLPPAPELLRGTRSLHGFIATSPGAAAWYPVTARIYRHQPGAARVRGKPLRVPLPRGGDRISPSA